MAIIYRADLQPTKPELIGAWLPKQPWYPGASDDRPEVVGAYRFDDPDGEVGIETHLVRAGDGPVLQVPLTYRAAPLPAAQSRLVGTTEHSVLGKRWVYDGCADPVYVSALAAAVLAGRPQAEEYVETSAGPERRETTASVSGSGGAAGDDVRTVVTGALSCAVDGDRTVCTTDDLVVTVHHVVGPPAGDAAEYVLTGTWVGQPDPVLLATVRRR